MPYEAVLLAQSPESQTEIATKQVRYAIKYRRREVERLLSRFILRREIIFHVGPDIYTHPDVRATRQLDPNRTPTKREIDKLNVEKSAFGGATLHVGREILVDAIQLIERLIEHRTKVGRPPGADWNEIERVARKIIESTGFPKTQADLERSILDSTVSDGDGSTTPRLATLHERLRELRAEYGAK